MAAVNKRLLLEALRSVAATSFNGTYIPLGIPIVFPARMMKFTNTSASDILISFDGVTDHEIIPASTFLVLDISSNRVWDCEFCLPAKTQVYISGAVQPTGKIYLSSYYAN